MVSKTQQKQIPQTTRQTTSLQQIYESLTKPFFNAAVGASSQMGFSTKAAGAGGGSVALAQNRSIPQQAVAASAATTPSNSGGQGGGGVVVGLLTRQT